MMNNYKQILLLIIGIYFSILSIGQENLSGKIISSDSKAPVESAHITLNYNNRTLGTISDTQGNFKFDINPKEIIGQLIEITALGYHDYYIIFDNQKNLTLKLTPQVYQIPEIIINPKNYIKIISVSPDTSGFVNDSTEINFLISYNILNFKKRKYDIQAAYKLKGEIKYRTTNEVPEILLKSGTDTILISFPVQFIKRSLTASYPYTFKFFIKKKRTKQAIAWTNEEYIFK